MSAEPRARLTPPVSDRDHTKGPDDSPVTLVEYGDYECPYCGQAENSVHEIQERTGNAVRMVFRHFPNRTVHPHARLAAEAAEAAGAQGKFWEMHDLLFQHQDQLEERELIEYARELGLDEGRFRTELEEHTHSKTINEDFRSGSERGVQGTPTWYINGKRYDGAWDPESLMEAVRKPMGVRISALTQEFTRLAAAGGVMLLIFSALALFWANSPFADSYTNFWQTELGISVGNLHLERSLLEWVNEGLMVIFFFVLGLEIKREVTAGELASPKKAALPIAAAVGGMLVPALFYTAFNFSNPVAMQGWAIPVATDIAFTLGILTVLGGRVPLSLKVFFTALAIADDVGGILIIALFYTSDINVASLFVALIFFAGLLLLNRSRVFSPLPYALLGIGLWLAFLNSGVHPTIAGVLLAVTLPTRSPPNVSSLMAQTDTVLNRYEYDETERRDHALVRTLKTILDRMEPPAQRLEHELQPWVTYLILPIFALANAGVTLGGAEGLTLLNPVSLGIIFGLVLGKPLGVGLFAWLAARTGVAEMPPDISWRQFFSAGALAGIGFAISLFIAQAAFQDSTLLSNAKIGILAGSILAAGLGWGLLNMTSPRYGAVTKAQAEPAPATD
ncbi:MAG: Na+/H+ antiporter NhaA [Nitrospirae bacterium]|nr:Na+/H+ antiporter NhaA [Nitrospirota bacterium]